MWLWKKRKPTVEASTASQAVLLPAVEETPSQRCTIPTARNVTEEVKADIAATLQAEVQLTKSWQDIYPVAVASIEEGRNLGRLASALIDVGLTNAEAGELALRVNGRAAAIINRSRQLAAGITQAKWLYSGAPCHPHRSFTEEEVRRDAAHSEANGKRYRVAEGMNINGTPTWPGLEPGCKCISVPVIPGFD